MTRLGIFILWALHFLPLGALLHMTYHALAKPVSLFSAGTLAQLHSSSDFNRCRYVVGCARVTRK